jgi:hypothetical protein
MVRPGECDSGRQEIPVRSGAEGGDARGTAESQVSEAAIYRRKLAAHLADPLNYPCPRMSRALREKMAEMGKKGGSAVGPKKRRSPEHYAKMALAKRRKRLGW